MAVIRQSDAVRIADQAITLDLGDLRAQGTAMIARAREQARAVVDEGLVQRQKLIEGAEAIGQKQGYDAGFAQGLEAGRVQGHEQGCAERREQLTQLEQAWTTALQSFERDRSGMMIEARQDILELAVQLARRVVKRAIEADPTLVIDQAGAVLSAAARSSRLVLRVHPDDVTLVREALPSLKASTSRTEHIEVLTDPALPRGSCTAQSAGGGVVDGTITTQLDRIAQALLVSRSEPPAPGATP